jgi:hypothetical protein
VALRDIMKNRPLFRMLVTLFTGILVLCPTVAMSKDQVEIKLAARGEELLGKYSKQLESLRAEVIAALPPLDEAKKARFLESRAKWNAIPNSGSDATPAEKKGSG